MPRPKASSSTGLAVASIGTEYDYLVVHDARRFPDNIDVYLFVKAPTQGYYFEYRSHFVEGLCDGRLSGDDFDTKLKYDLTTDLVTQEDDVWATVTAEEVEAINCALGLGGVKAAVRMIDMFSEESSR